MPEVLLKLGVRVYRCSNKECSLVMDRDYNAALNILKKGSERAHVEEEASTYCSNGREVLFERR